jgi:hypothetical protein
MGINYERVAHGNVMPPHIHDFRFAFPWAIEGIRFASAASTEEALRNA